jgi:hypothetical protein
VVGETDFLMKRGLFEEGSVGMMFVREIAALRLVGQARAFPNPLQ